MSFNDITNYEPRPGSSQLCFNGVNYQMMHYRVNRDQNKKREQNSDNNSLYWRRQCGCFRTSEKLKQILKSFPSAPPPSPELVQPDNKVICVSLWFIFIYSSNSSFKILIRLIIVIG